MNIILKLRNDSIFSTPSMIFGCIIFIWKDISKNIPHSKLMIKKSLLIIIFIFEVLIDIKKRWWCHKNLFLLKICTYCLLSFFSFPHSLWRYWFLLSFRLKFAVYERHGQTCYLVCIHDLKKEFVWEILQGTNNTTRNFRSLACKKLWREKKIWSENDSSYMIILVYRYVCYIKTSILLNP